MSRLLGHSSPTITLDVYSHWPGVELIHRRPQRLRYDFSFGGETVLANDGNATFERNVDRLLSFAQDV